MIEKNLYEWLLNNDSLLVPDLGQFNAMYKSTVIHPGIHHFLPPNKELSFYPSSKFNDGVFENYIATKEDLPVIDVQNKIKQYVTTVKIEVGINRKYAIDNFGSLILNPDGVLEFRADENTSFLAESYGLPSLFYKPIERLNLQSEDDGEETIFEKEELVEPATSSMNGLWKYIAGAAILAGVSFGVWYVAQNDLISFPDWSASTEEEKKEDDKIEVIEKKKETNKDFESEVTEKNNNQGDKSKINDKKKKEEEEVKTVEEEKITSDGNGLKNFAYNPTPPANLENVMIQEATSRYYVVIGSFDETGNAYSFYNNASSKGFKNCKIVTQNKKYRISSQDFKTKEEATRYQDKLKKSHQIDAWTMKY